MSRRGSRGLSRSIAIGWVSAAVILTTGCAASNSVAPVDLTPVSLLLTSNTTVASTSVFSGQVVYFRAYALTKDGGYDDVTGRATWVGTAPLTPFSASPGGFNTLGVGTGRATASYGGFQASLAEDVVTLGVLTYPALSMVDLGHVKFGDQVQLTAMYQPDAFSAPRLVSGVSWASFEPSIVQITGSTAQAAGIGTTLVTLSYLGVTTRTYFSVFPR